MPPPVPTMSQPDTTTTTARCKVYFRDESGNRWSWHNVEASTARDRAEAACAHFADQGRSVDFEVHE